MVTRFQQAVLQEMGIPLWRPQADVARNATNDESVVSDASTVTRPASEPQSKRSENSSSHLAALRQSLTTPSSAPAPASEAASVPSPQQTPTSRVLTDDEARHSMVSDILRAAELCGLTANTRIEVSTALAVTAGRIVLPDTPATLSMQSKRELWHLLCAQSPA